MSTIVVALDGSQLAERALPYAERVAHAVGARVVLVQVIPEPGRTGSSLKLTARRPSLWLWPATVGQALGAGSMEASWTACCARRCYRCCSCWPSPRARPGADACRSPTRIWAFRGDPGTPAPGSSRATG